MEQNITNKFLSIFSFYFFFVPYVRKLPILVFIVCCSSLSFSQEIGSPFVRYYSPKEYDNTPQVWGAIQDSNGMMYFGMTNGGGILEFDGREWRTIEIPNKTTVFSFAQSREGRIYTGAINDFGYLRDDSLGKKEFVSLRHLIERPDLKFRAVWQVRIVNNDVYFYAVDALFRYSSLPEPAIRTYLPETGTTFLGLFDYQGTIYVHQKERGLFTLDGDRFEPVNDFYKDKQFRSGLLYAEDSILVTTRNHGLYIFRPSTGVSTPFTIKEKGEPQQHSIYSTSLLENGYVTVTTSSHGVLKIAPDGEIVQRWNEENALPTNSVYTIYPTAAKRMWFMMENGIVRTEESLAWSFWDKTSGLQGTVSDILRFENRLYVSTFNGIYVLNAEDRMENIQGIPPGQNWSLMEYTTPGNKKMLLAGTAAGIYQIEGGKAVLVRSGSYGLTMIASQQDPSRIFAVDDPSVVSIRYVNGRWKEEGVIAGIRDNIRRMIEDDNGDLWLGTYNAGVIRVTMDPEKILAPKNIRYFTQNDGLPSLRTVYPRRVNNDIVFSTEKGLVQYHPESERFEPYQKIDPRFSSGDLDVGTITETNDGSFVIFPLSNKSHDPGILRKNPEGRYEWVYKPFRKLGRLEFNAVLSEPGGVLWIGTTDGLIRYERRLDSDNYEAPFSAVLRQVLVGGDSVVSYGGNVTTAAVPYELNDVSFKVAAPFFSSDQTMLFSHRLSGFDNEWSPWSPNSFAVYTNLTEGVYIYRVKAKNIFDTESSIAEFTLTVEPPWYRTWWAYLSYILLLGGFIVSFDIWNKNRLKGIHDRQHAEEKQRQHLFSQKLIERQEEERKRISREMHDGIGQELLILKHQLELKLRSSTIDDETKAMLEEQSGTASNIITEVRNISHDLRPPELDRLGLTETIKSILNRLRNTKKITVIGEIDSVDEFFPKNLEINIVRILQECINNILKHANASTVTITLTRDESSVRLSVADDGSGMEMRTGRPSGLGMNDIKERVEVLGGTMEIDTMEQKGTTFRFHFPSGGTYAG